MSKNSVLHPRIQLSPPITYRVSQSGVLEIFKSNWIKYTNIKNKLIFSVVALKYLHKTNASFMNPLSLIKNKFCFLKIFILLSAK